MIEINGNKISGKRKEILEILKKKANPNCNTCYGKGTIGFKENKNGSRTYIPCGKCIEGNRQIPKSKGFIFNKQKKVK